MCYVVSEILIGMKLMVFKRKIDVMMENYSNNNQKMLFYIANDGKNNL